MNEATAEKARKCLGQVGDVELKWDGLVGNLSAGREFFGLAS